MLDEELKQIVKENKQILEKLDKKIQRIEKRFIWNSIFGFIKILVIVAPIVLGIIYLTPFLQDFIKIYDPILKNLPLTIQNFNTDSQINANNQQMIESFCNPEARQAMVDQLCK